MQTGTAVARNGDALTLGDTLYRSARTVVRRGLRGATPVIVKSLAPEASNALELSLLRREFELNCAMTGARVCQALDFDESLGAIIFEDRGCVALRDLIQHHAPDLADRLRIAIHAAEALASVHAEGIIHRDVNPANILVSERDRAVFLIDFGCAIPLSGKNHAALLSTEPDPTLTGTLAYLSPEQTGRVNRRVDHRTDLYALGITLYELFTGAPPFTHKDPLELIHAHIAVTPIAAHEVDPRLPVALSAIMTKLLAKQPEERYQSARAVADDLREVARHGNVLPFRPGRTDAPRQLVRPQRLYGRDAELEQLIDRVERVAAGEVHFAEISGAAGSGKRALANALLRHVRDADFLTARLNGEALRGHSGPSLLLALLRRVIQHALARQGAPSEQFLDRVSRLPAEHHGNLRQHVPELAGRLKFAVPEAHDPGRRHARSRTDADTQCLDRTATALLEAALPMGICAVIDGADLLPEAPVRWLLETAASSRRLLILMCQSLPDPLLSQEPRFASRTTRIGLGPIGRGDVRRLIGDMLSLGEMHVRELALVLHDKSGGNPGHLEALVHELHHEGLIRYDEKTAAWRYDLHGIEAHYFSNTTSTHLRARIETLPESTRAALGLAAAWGEDLSARILESIFVWSAAETTAALRPALREGLLQTASSTTDEATGYRFTHTRVRAQVYALLTPDRRRELHGHLADYLETSAAENLQPEGVHRFVRLADQLNAALDPVMATEADRARCAQANLFAARQSANMNAWQACYRYARCGLALPLDTTATATETRSRLYELAADAAFHCADLEQLERVLNEAPNELVALQELGVRAAVASADLDTAIQRALTAVAHLPLLDPARAPPPRGPLARQRRRYARARATRSPIEPIPPLDAPLEPAVRIAAHALDAAYRSGRANAGALALQLIEFGQAQGFAPGHAVAAARVAIDAMADGDAQGAARAAALAQRLIDAFPDTLFADRARALLAGLLAPWTATAFDPLLDQLAAIRARAEGRFDVECARLCRELSASLALLRGIGLPVLERSIVAERLTLPRFPADDGTDQTAALHHSIARLTGRATTSFALAPRNHGNDLTARAHEHLISLYTDMLLADHAGAERHRRAARAGRSALGGSIFVALFDWCDALLDLRRLAATEAPTSALVRSRAQEKAHAQERERALRGARRCASRMAETAVPIFGSKLSLLRAEICWQEGATADALTHCEQAAARARELGLAQDEALALERATDYAHASSRPDVARGFATGAHRAWNRWGAHARTSALESAYPAYLSSRSRTEAGSTVTTETARLGLPGAAASSGLTQDRVTLETPLLETQTILRAAQALSGEIVLDALLQRLLGLALEHAGAQRSCMLLVRDDRLLIEAIANADQPAAQILAPAVPLENSDVVPESIILFAARTQQAVVLDDATRSDVFSQDPYVKGSRPLAVMALPILHRAELSGVLYLEHRALDGVFTPERVAVLSLLASQAAISIENARLYADLQATRDEYQTLYDNALEGLFRITSNGHLINANPTLARILDFDSVPELMEGYRNLLPSSFLSREHLGAFFSALDERGMVTDFAAEGVTRTGRTVWLAITARLSRSADGAEFIEGSFVDISERIARDHADKQREIAEAATLAKSAFLANMSHEIRTPMNAVLGFSKLALETRLDDRQHAYVSSIRNSADNLLRLINDILDFSKIEAGKIALEAQPFRLASVLDDVMSLFSIEIRRQKLGFHLTDRTSACEQFPQDGVVVGDAMRLRQVLVNLVGNAIKFTAEGRVDIDVEALGRRTRADGDEVLEIAVAVSDTGIGIAAADRERLFESFEQAEPSITRRFGGTGLGLSICRRLVEEMGGAIDVSSAPGQGSTFRFTIQLGVPATPALLTEPHTRDARNASVLEQRRLLVVEDNPINQQLALEFLTRAGATVEIAENGREAIDRATGSTFDAILMDIHMPVMDGLEATRCLRASGCDLPIIAVSADALASHRAAALAAGCNAYVTKPIDFDVLLSELGRLLPSRATQPRRRASDRAADAAAASASTAGGSVTGDAAISADPDTAALTANPGGLERLPGIDIAAAIKGHNGNVRLLLKLMGDFGRYYGDAGPRIRRMVTEGAFEEAERLAHNLHGVAGSFGARRLQGASKTLEIALAGDERGHLLGLVQNFELALAEVLTSAEALARERVALRASDRADR